MKNSNRVSVIAGVVILLLLIGIWIWAANRKSTPVVLPQPGLPPQPVSTAGLGNIVDFFRNLFRKKETTSYVQVEPIDENGCDANGYNKIGVKCFIF